MSTYALSFKNRVWINNDDEDKERPLKIIYNLIDGETYLTLLIMKKETEEDEKLFSIDKNYIFFILEKCIKGWENFIDPDDNTAVPCSNKKEIADGLRRLPYILLLKVFNVIWEESQIAGDLKKN